MLKKKLLPRDPYGSSITLLWGSREEINAFLKRVLGSDYPDIKPAVRAHTTEWTPTGRSPIHYVSVIREECNDRFARLAALGHELLHVTLAVLEFRGVQITTENDEPVAYYFEWLFRHCAKEVW
jgi:hypothetical protein